MTRLPELLAPAGGFAALQAAIEAGADAVYFGGEQFGARAFAQNFSRGELRDAAKLCRAYSVKSYVTLNTLIFDREFPDMLRYAAFLEEAGIDALIVADLGAASCIRRHIPTMRLHASTQFSGHNAHAAEILAENGFERMVAARELSFENLSRLCAASPIEIEVFAHGALCVCHSGQCLYSAMLGGRSGNRGMCAQPCRLPDARGRYPLSLRDLALAGRIPKLIETGAASLKIEGRMKSPEYVYGVTSIYRRLLDERRAANAEEMRRLSEIFSRGGFTSGYFDRKINRSMLGVRAAEDKRKSRSQTPFSGLERKCPVRIFCTFASGKPFRVAVSGEKGSAEAFGRIPEAAKSAPLDKQALEKNLLKLGGTPYTAKSADIEFEEGLILRIGEINAVRREALARYAALGERAHVVQGDFSGRARAEFAPLLPTALVMRAKNLPSDPKFYEYFETVFLPLAEFSPALFPRVRGVQMPGVVPDDEYAGVLQALRAARAAGADWALVGNYGHLALAREAGFQKICGDFRLNITNGFSADFAKENGFSSLILSPELSLAQARDVGGRSRIIVYGRVPLMLLEKCVVREIADCGVCGADRAALTDRRGARFPILREPPHRNILFNSVPVYMADKPVACGGHFIFSTESAKETLEVVRAYREKLPHSGNIRRIREK